MGNNENMFKCLTGNKRPICDEGVGWGNKLQPLPFLVAPSVEKGQGNEGGGGINLQPLLLY